MVLSEFVRKLGTIGKSLITILITSFCFIILGLLAFQEGEEFQVNTHVEGRQVNPIIAMNKKGNFVIIWDSSGQDGSAEGIFAQRFNKKGKAIGSEFQVNTYTRSSYPKAAGAMDEKGNFVVAWTGYDGQANGIFAQRFNRKGKAIGPEFQVNTYPSSSYPGPSVAMDRRGNFVIAWTGGDGQSAGVFAQRFNRRGEAVGFEFPVNTYTYDNQYYPSVAMDKKGNFVITWESWYQDGSYSGISAQRFNKSGKAIGSEFQVNTFTDYIQERPAVAMDKKGNFIIAWMSDGQDGSNFGIFAQRFNKKGKAIGPEFQVNTYFDHAQGSPAVAMDEKGNFVIVWDSLGQDGYGGGIFAQMYDRKGAAIGPEFQVNTYYESHQGFPAIAMDKRGNFVIAWESLDQDGSDYGIFAKRFIN